MKRRTFLLAAAAAALRPGRGLAAPRAELWPRWQAADPGSERMLDHGLWAEFLSRHTVLSGDGIVRVDYAGATSRSARLLADYLAGLADAEVSALNRAEQFPFWVNLYNALTVQVILEHLPVGSIQDIDISPGFFASGPWGAKLLEIEGERLSLDDIEHRILRPIWRDPRIHYAVNCAALGCPNLQRVPFTAANSEALLEQGARAYVNHPRGAQANGNRLRVSSIYVWYQEDFGGDDAGVIAHLKSYAEGDLAERLGYIGEIASDDYDWDLNLL